MNAKKIFKNPKIAVIPGDGIGKEVMPEGVRALEAANRKFGIGMQFDHFDFASCDYYLKHGKMMPDDWFETLMKYDAIFFGAVKLLEKIEANLPTHTLLLDLKNVIYIDTSGMDTIVELAHLCKMRQVKLIICGLDHQPLEMAQRSGFLEMLPKDCFCTDLYSGIKMATNH